MIRQDFLKNFIMTATLINYTEDRIRVRSQVGSPFIKILPSGTFYLYARAIKQLQLDLEDKVLFSEDPKTGTWYISKDAKGVKLYLHNEYTRVFSSTVIRKQILNSQLIPAISQEEIFYLNIESIPTLIGQKAYYKLKLLQ